VREVVIDALAADQVDQPAAVMDALLARIDPVGSMTRPWIHPAASSG
jgi:hypothetical protein